MNTPDDTPYWLQTLQLAVVAMIGALARGLTWRDPKTGKLSPAQVVQSLATAWIIAALAAGSQAEWSVPWPITATIAALGALIGLPTIISAAQQIFDTAVQLFKGRLGGKSASPDDTRGTP